MTPQGKRIREGIIHFFRERDCVALVRPCNEEHDLKRMDKMDEKDLRPEFLRELNIIRDKIYRQCGPKKLKGINLNTRMYVNMVSDYVNSINGGSVPVIENAWVSVLRNELQTALEDAEAEFKYSLKQQYNPEIPLSYDDTLAIVNDCRDKALSTFGIVNHIFVHSSELYYEYMKKLKETMDNLEARFIDQSSKTANK